MEYENTLNGETNYTLINYKLLLKFKGLYENFRNIRKYI